MESRGLFCCVVMGTWRKPMPCNSFTMGSRLIQHRRSDTDAPGDATFVAPRCVRPRAWVNSPSNVPGHGALAAHRSTAVLARCRQNTTRQCMWRTAEFARTVKLHAVQHIEQIGSCAHLASKPPSNEVVGSDTKLTRHDTCAPERKAHGAHGIAFKTAAA